MTLGSSEFNAGQSTDDEDEGSLLRGRVNPDRKRREKIERSADALRERHNPDSFPSEIIPLTIFSGQPENQMAGSGNMSLQE